MVLPAFRLAECDVRVEIAFDHREVILLVTHITTLNPFRTKLLLCS